MNAAGETPNQKSASLTQDVYRSAILDHFTNPKEAKKTDAIKDVGGNNAVSYKIDENGMFIVGMKMPGKDGGMEYYRQIYGGVDEKTGCKVTSFVRVEDPDGKTLYEENGKKQFRVEWPGNTFTSQDLHTVGDILKGKPLTDYYGAVESHTEKIAFEIRKLAEKDHIL